MIYRFATRDDFPAFERMLRACLVEQELAGGQVLASRKTLDAYRDLAHAYLSGSLFGVIVLVEDPGIVGFALAGENTGPSRLDTPLGKVAIIWEVWVNPSHRKTGAGLGMLTFGRETLVEMGFQTAVMTVLESNPEGQALTLSFGAKPIDRGYHFPLREAPRERTAQQPGSTGHSGHDVPGDGHDAEPLRQ